jgi:N-acetylneuraminic acid mutarotase
MYVTGGYTDPRDLKRPTAALFRYDPLRDRWKRLRDAPTARAAHTMQAIGHKLYVIGGVDASGATGRMEVYDKRRDRWVRGPAMPTPREHLASAIAYVPNRPRHRLYVLGGRTAQAGDLATVESYDPATRRWRREPSMRKARGGFAAVQVDGLHLAVFGGEEASGTIAEVEQFDVAKRRWSALPDLPTPRHGLGGVDFRRQIFALEGGPQPGLAFSNAVEVLTVP